jgi:hypothetical protein
MVSNYSLDIYAQLCIAAREQCGDSNVGFKQFAIDTATLLVNSPAFLLLARNQEFDPTDVHNMEQLKHIYQCPITSIVQLYVQLYSVFPVSRYTPEPLTWLCNLLDSLQFKSSHIIQMLLNEGAVTVWANDYAQDKHNAVTLNRPPPLVSDLVIPVLTPSNAAVVSPKIYVSDLIKQLIKQSLPSDIVFQIVKKCYTPCFDDQQLQQAYHTAMFDLVKHVATGRVAHEPGVKKPDVFMFVSLFQFNSNMQM